MEKLARGAQRLGLSLSSAQLALFEIYYNELVDWNRSINLTAIVDYEEVQTKHFLDSLTVAVALGPATPGLVDVGSGAGFPGLPLKILLPALEVVLVDSVAKKVAFLQHMMRRLQLSGVTVVQGRAEEIAHQPQFRENFAAVVSRAVAPLSVLVEFTLPLASMGGRVIAQKGQEIADEMAGALGAIAKLGGRVKEIKDVSQPELGQRHLVVIEKVAATPARYPRRPGIPAQRPLK